MAKPRRPETAYERRIRRYIELHPGATRQEARGKRAGEYERRIERGQERYPGIPKRVIAGHGKPDEKEAMRMIRLIPRLTPDAQIAFTGVDRQKDGTWRVARFDVLDAGDYDRPGIHDLAFEIGPDGHYLLPRVAMAIRDAGWANLGAQYLSMMAENGIRLRDATPVSNPNGPVFADGVRVGTGMDEQGVRAELERSMRRWKLMP